MVPCRSVPGLDRTFLRQLATTLRRGLSEETVQVSITSRHSEVERRVVPLQGREGRKSAFNHTRSEFRSDGRRNRGALQSPQFVTPNRDVPGPQIAIQGRSPSKNTTLRPLRVASVQPSISPTSSPPKGATKLQRYYPLEIGIRLWEFLFPRARTCHRIS